MIFVDVFLGAGRLRYVGGWLWERAIHPIFLNGRRAKFLVFTMSCPKTGMPGTETHY